MTEKTVILSAIDNSNKKAVLNLNNNSDEVSGFIRLYNFKGVSTGILSLGFLINNQVFKAALTEKSKGYYSFNFKIATPVEKFSCALINIKNGEPNPLLLGSNDRISSDLTLSLVKNFKYLDKPQISSEEVELSLDEANINYDEEIKEEINEVLDQEFKEEDRCIKCEYRDAFYNCEKINAESSEMPQNLYYKKINPLNESKNFYDDIQEQLNVLFDKYPEETFLNEVIPNSKWVKVDYEGNGNYIVIGLIYENNQIQYVCYGSPGEYSAIPPREFNGLSQWLPLDVDKPDELGYWIIYQDAETGENVEIKIS